MQNLQPNIYIVSGALAGDSPGYAASKTAVLRGQLRALGYAVADVHGAYKGKTEPALLVIDPAPFRDTCERDVLRLARQYAQESILHVDSQRQARLIYCDTGELEALGGFNEVTEAQAKRCDAYVCRAGRYWVAGPIAAVA